VDYARVQPRALTIAVTKTSPWDDWVDISLDPIARDALQVVADLASTVGHHVSDSSWVPQPGYAEAFFTLWKASAVSLDIPPESRPLVEPITAYLIEQGEKLQARDLAQALTKLSLFEEHTLRAFADSDVILTPGLAVEAPRIGFYNYDDPRENFRQQVQVTPFSSFVNVCGLPAMALPVTSTAQGVPVGVQLIGKPGSEATLISLAAQLETVIGWDQSPQL
jgi:amidase